MILSTYGLRCVRLPFSGRRTAEGELSYRAPILRAQAPRSGRRNIIFASAVDGLRSYRATRKKDYCEAKVRFGMVKPLPTAGRATKAASARATLLKSAKPTRCPAS